jgi:signal transduction histidine kinase
MSLCASFLSAALARLNLLEDERTRALELEREVLRISDLERLRFSVDLHDDTASRWPR